MVNYEHSPRGIITRTLIGHNLRRGDLHIQRETLNPSRIEVHLIGDNHLLEKKAESETAPCGPANGRFRPFGNPWLRTEARLGCFHGW